MIRREASKVKSRRLFHFGPILLLSILGQPVFADAGIDPEGSGVFVNAVHWLQGTLLGTVATVVAVIAIASVGFMMLAGRINWRHGAVVFSTGRDTF